HVEELAGGEAGPFVGEVEHRLGDLVRLAEPPNREYRRSLLLLLVGELVEEHRRGDRARRDDVHGDPVWGELVGERSCQADHRRLRRGVPGIGREAWPPAKRVASYA